MMKRACIVVLFFLSFVAHGQQQTSDEIRMSIYFGGGSYDIDEFQQQALLHWLDSIPNLDRYEVHLISHTDPIGGKRYNEWLSKMRSESVEQLILRQNIPQHKISRKDWGLDNAVYSNQTYRGMQMNRRVDVILYPIVFWNTCSWVSEKEQCFSIANVLNIHKTLFLSF